MSAYAGSLVPTSAPYVALDRLPLVLLLGALIVAFSHGLLEPKRRHAVSLVSIGMALGLWAVHAAQLWMLEPSRQALRDVTTNLFRIGSFDANLGFFFDPIAAFALLLPLVGGVIFLARTKFGPTNDLVIGRLHANVLLLISGVATSIMADGFVGLLIGLSLSIIATFLLVLRDEHLAAPVPTASRVFLLQTVGGASLLTAFVSLFWSLGGSWREDGYLNDYRARFVSVHAPGHMSKAEEVVMPEEAPRGQRDAGAIAERAKEKGSLTFTSHPGARVYIDVGDKLLDHAEPFGVTPFVRKQLAAGVHDVVIVPGGASIVTGDGHEVSWIERLVVDAGEDVSIVPLGQATTFSEVEDQLILADEAGKHFLRNALIHRTVFGSLNVIDVVVFLVALGAFFLTAPVLLTPWFAGISSTPSWNVLRLSSVVLGLYPLMRLQSFASQHLALVGVVFVVGALLSALLRSRRPSLILGAATIAMMLMSARAEAQENDARFVLRSEFGDVVELEYAPDGETMRAAFVVRNVGTKPLTVSRAHLVHSDAVPRLPPFVSAELDGAKGEPVVIEPGKQHRVIVRWKYADARARELFALAWVETNATREGGYAVVHASRSRDLGPWGDRALSFLIGFPFVATILALILRLLRKDAPKLLGAASTLVFGGLLAFVLAIVFRFDTRFARADGNDGLQFIEHSVLFPNLGVEWFLGVDGLSLTLVVMTSIAAFLMALASFSNTKMERPAHFHILAPMFISSLMGIFLVQDLFLFCAFSFLGVLTATMLILDRAGANGRRGAIGFGAIALACAVFLGASAYWLHGFSDATNLVNGQFVVRAWSFPDLARVDWIHSARTLYEPTGFILVWSALFVAFVAQLVISGRVFAFLDAPANFILPAGWVAGAMYGLLRLNLGVLPIGLNWAATTVIVVGIAMILVFGWLARKATDVKAFVGNASIAFSGLALVGMGSRTPQGIAAAVGIVVALTLAFGMFSMLVQALENRKLALDLQSLTSLSNEMPLLGAVFAIATFVTMGLPGLVGFWSFLLAIVGTFPRQPLLAIATILAMVFLGATQIRIVGQMVVGKSKEKSRKEKLSDLAGNELWVLIPLVLLAVGLGLAPRTLFSLLDAVILDLHRLVDAAGSSQIG